MSIYQDEITLIADFNTIINNESLCEQFTGEVVIKISPNGRDEGWYRVNVEIPFQRDECF